MAFRKLTLAFKVSSQFKITSISMRPCSACWYTPLYLSTPSLVRADPLNPANHGRISRAQEGHAFTPPSIHRRPCSANPRQAQRDDVSLSLCVCVRISTQRSSRPEANAIHTRGESARGSERTVATQDGNPPKCRASTRPGL